MTGVAALGLCLTLAAAAGPAPPPENGVSTLADSLAAAINARFALPEGTLVRVRGAQAVADLPETAAGTELEWLARDADLLDPTSLVPIGQVRRPCGRLRVTGGGPGMVLGTIETDPGCPPPAPGDPVRVRPRSLRLGLERGVADPSLQGLLDLLLAVLPDRLERSGWLRVAVAPGRDELGPPATGRGELVEQLSRTDRDAVAILGLASRGRRIEALAEIVAIRPRSFHDVAQVEVAAVPAALWRGRARRPAAGERTSIEVAGEALAVAAWFPSEDVRPVLLVLTDLALLGLRLQADGSLASETLQSLERLPRAATPCRVSAGSLVVDGAGREARICFAATRIEGGWCWQAGRIEPVDGVPLPGPSGILLGRYQAGTDRLTGELRAFPGGAVVADLKPFLALATGAAGRPLVYRPDGVVEWLDRGLAPTGISTGPCGDGFVALGPGRVTCSAARPRGEADEIQEPGNAGSRHAVAGNVVAIAPLDLDGDGVPELVVASTVEAGPTQVIVLDGAE